MVIKGKEIKALIFVAVAVGLPGCSRGGGERLREYALQEAGENAPALLRLLERYDERREGREERESRERRESGESRESGERRALAEYTVEAMAGQAEASSAGIDSLEAIYQRIAAQGRSQLEGAELERARQFAAMPLRRQADAATLSEEYLAANIDDTYRLWQLRPWNRELTVEQVGELLLPYRIGNEPITSWRETYRQHLDSLEAQLAEVDNSVDAARIVASHIGPVAYNDQLSTPHRSALRLLDVPLGYCRDDCDRTLYAMRSVGIPVAVDMMPVSPDNGGSHQWNVVYDNDSRRYRMFDNLRYLPTRDSLHNDQRRKGKVYRYLFRPEFERSERYSAATDAPTWLLNPRLKDVTAEYFGENRAEVEVSSDAGDVYLGLFTAGGFRPIDIARRQGNRAVFTNIEPRVIFFAVRRGKSGAFERCSLPFMLENDGTVHLFRPDTTRTVAARLTRKFPIRFHQRERLASVVGLQVQVSDAPGGPWRTIHTVEQSPAGNYYRLPVGNVGQRFIRLYKPSGTTANLSELLASRDTLGLDTIALEIYGTEEARHKYRYLADGDIMMGNPLEAGATDLVFRNPGGEVLPYLFIVPSNDDNFVVPQQVYELLCFTESGVKSLGRQTAKGFAVEYDVPENAVLWLRNLSKGREEQPFIFTDRQLFNIDL